MFSLSSGDDMSRVEMIFNDLQLPELSDDVSLALGGIVEEHNFMVSTENGNKLILTPFNPGEVINAPGSSITNQLFLNVPIIDRSDEFYFQMEHI